MQEGEQDIEVGRLVAIIVEKQEHIAAFKDYNPQALTKQAPPQIESRSIEEKDQDSSAVRPSPKPQEQETVKQASASINSTKEQDSVIADSTIPSGAISDRWTNVVRGPLLKRIEQAQKNYVEEYGETLL